MRALGPGAPVWARLPAVAGVRVLDPTPDGAGLAPEPGAGRPVLIPLLEPHIRARPRGYFALCPGDEALDTLADKARFASYVARHGLAALCPAVYDTVEAARFPLLAKPTLLNAGRGIRVLADRAQHDAFRASPDWAARPHILQEYLDDRDDYGTHLFCRDGRIVWHRAFRFRLPPGAPIRGPVSPLTSQPCRLDAGQIGQIERVLAPLAYSGPCNVDHKIAPDGSLRILEINPRLGGSLLLPANVADLAHVLGMLIADAVFERAGAGAPA